jgi:hypothetical protein
MTQFFLFPPLFLEPTETPVREFWLAHNLINQISFCVGGRRSSAQGRGWPEFSKLSGRHAKCRRKKRRLWYETDVGMVRELRNKFAVEDRAANWTLSEQREGHDSPEVSHTHPLSQPPVGL